MSSDWDNEGLASQNNRIRYILYIHIIYNKELRNTNKSAAKAKNSTTLTRALLASPDDAFVGDAVPRRQG
jgi:hypothetical protein